MPQTSTFSLVLFLGLNATWPLANHAQICDPSTVPSGLEATYVPGVGAQLQWDLIPGSAGVQLKATSPSGSTITRRIVGFELAQFDVPGSLLSNGTYTWRVQAACSTIPPYNVTPISASNNFVVGPSGTCPSTVTDIDGNIYNTVEIGSQCWIARNLEVEHYQNGDEIPMLSNYEWIYTVNGARAVFAGNPINKNLYGLLYNWHTLNDTRGLCPSGWHVPSDLEWTELTDLLGGELVAGGALKELGILGIGTGLWQSPNAEATNTAGFSGLPGGYREYYGTYFYLGFYGFWWSSSEFDSTNAWRRRLDYHTGNVARFGTNKQFGMSVRCLKN